MTIGISEGIKFNEVKFPYKSKQGKSKQGTFFHTAIVFNVEGKLYYGFDKAEDLRTIFNGKNYRPISTNGIKHYQVKEDQVIEGQSDPLKKTDYKEIAEGKVMVPKLKRVVYLVHFIALACLSILIVPLLFEKYRRDIHLKFLQARNAHSFIPLCVKEEKKNALH